MADNDAQPQGEVPKRPVNRSGVYYPDYLKLDQILTAQVEESKKISGQAAHEEHLFIVIHQVYELWFKQILHELRSVAAIFAQPSVPERSMLVVNNRLKRVVEIQKILVDQIRVLETMDPLDFLSFRNYLVPASGFQSLQFRLIENLMGISVEKRTKYQQQYYRDYFSEKDAAELIASEQGPTLVGMVEKWLERTPGLSQGSYVFWNEYAAGVRRMLEDQRRSVQNRQHISEAEREALLQACAANEEAFDHMLDADKYEQLRQQGVRTMSHRAMQGALMIHLYRFEPKYNMPYEFLTLLKEVDAFLGKWRYEHVQMVQRIIGSKVGTGGSSGYQYLRSTISDRYKAFLDLFNLPTYLVPREYTPVLPKEIAESLDYR